MKKRHIYILSALLTLTALGSCKKYLDINKNPNAAEAVDPKLLFSTATVQYITKRADGDLWIPVALAGQTVSGGGSNADGWNQGSSTEEQYIFDPLIFNNTWRYLYTTIGAGLKQAITLSEAAVPKNNNAAAQCKVLLAQSQFDATCMWGDVPFKEALDPAISFPHFDDQKSVMEGIITLLDQAIAQFDETSALKISDYDLFYAGDIAKWKKYAKSLKLRVLMVMVDKDPTKAAAIGTMITAGGFISSAADNAKVAWSTVAGRENPKYRMISQYYGGINPFFASDRVVNFMNSINDPRLPFYFDKPAAAPGYLGLQNGADGDDTKHARLSLYLHRKDAPEIFFSYQEQLFFEAEIQARGLGVTANLTTANTLYKKAVEESAKFNTVPAGTAATFAASLPNLSTFATTRDAVKYIHMHHWVDEMDRVVDAFTQFRRSGPEGDEVPALTPAIGAAAGGIFRRYEYPVSVEVQVNPNAPQTKVKYDVKMWFDL